MMMISPDEEADKVKFMRLWRHVIICSTNTAIALLCCILALLWLRGLICYTFVMKALSLVVTSILHFVLHFYR